MLGDKWRGRTGSPFDQHEFELLLIAYTGQRRRDRHGFDAWKLANPVDRAVDSLNVLIGRLPPISAADVEREHATRVVAEIHP